MNTNKSIIQTLFKQREPVLCLGKVYEEFYNNDVWKGLFGLLEAKELEHKLPGIERSKYLVVMPIGGLREKLCVLREVSMDSALPLCNVVLVKTSDYLLKQFCFIFQKVDDWDPRKLNFEVLSAQQMRHLVALMYFPYSEGDGTGVSKELLSLRDTCIAHDMLLSTALIGGCRRLGYGEGESEQASMEKSRSIYKSVKINAVCFTGKSLTLPGLSLLLNHCCGINDIINHKRKEIKEICDRLDDGSLVLFINIKMQLMQISERNMKMLYNNVIEILTDNLGYPAYLIPKSFNDLFKGKSTETIVTFTWDELSETFPKKVKSVLLNYLKKFL